MVAHPRTPSRPDQLRPLNPPRPVRVVARAGRPAAGGQAIAQPLAVIDRGRRVAILAIEETWSVLDEWWRQTIDRWYYRVHLADGRSRTIYHDRVNGTWFAQAY
ncbi:MAG: hypothetical protein M3462_13120 [Chloroflexota bacterium]|nr:hypothetical protein [Chloroflexota bacterium]